MMNYEEAIDNLNNRFLLCPIDCAEDCEVCRIEAVQLAIEALEKQTPKMPVKTDLWEMCPTCYEKYGFDFDILVGMRGLKTGLCYCLNCGQRIADSEVSR